MSSSRSAAPSVGERGHADHRAGEVEDGRGRHVVVLRRDRALDGGEAAALGLAPDGAEEARLADPGLAGEQQELPVPGQDVVEPAVGELEQLVPPDQERTADGARRAVHGTGV